MIEHAVIIEGHDWRPEHADLAAVWMWIYSHGNDAGDPDFICGFPGRRECRPGFDIDFFVVADLHLADGSTLIGLVTPDNDEAHEPIYGLTARYWPDGRSAHTSIHAADPHPGDQPKVRDPARRQESARDRVLTQLARSRTAVFPITVTPRAAITGWAPSWTSLMSSPDAAWPGRCATGRVPSASCPEHLLRLPR